MPSLTNFRASLFACCASNGAHSMAKHEGHGIPMWPRPRGSAGFSTPWQALSRQLQPLHPCASACPAQVLRFQGQGGGAAAWKLLRYRLQAWQARPRCAQPSMAAQHGTQSTHGPWPPWVTAPLCPVVGLRVLDHGFSAAQHCSSKAESACSWQESPAGQQQYCGSTPGLTPQPVHGLLHSLTQVHSQPRLLTQLYCFAVIDAYHNCQPARSCQAEKEADQSMQYPGSCRVSKLHGSPARVFPEPCRPHAALSVHAVTLPLVLVASWEAAEACNMQLLPAKALVRAPGASRAGFLETHLLGRSVIPSS